MYLLLKKVSSKNVSRVNSHLVNLKSHLLFTLWKFFRCYEDVFISWGLGIPCPGISGDIWSSNNWYKWLLHMPVCSDSCQEHCVGDSCISLPCGYHRSNREGRLLNKLLWAISSWSPFPVIMDLTLDRSFWKCIFHLVLFAGASLMA